MREVRAATALATVSGAETSERVGFMWISASQTASRPHSSAASICANEFAKASCCEAAPVDQNSWKMPNSIADSSPVHYAPAYAPAYDARAGRLATSCTSLRRIASAKLSKSFATATNEAGPPITFLR